MTCLHLRAPAKLNLALRVVGRRADGYHELVTLFHAIDLCDDLYVAADCAGVQFTATAADPTLAVPVDASNLVVRALQLLREHAGAAGFRAHLHKRIPHGGGLGGGSSDAAAALRLGNALLPRPLAAAELHPLAARLGADVPFCLAGGSQWGRGVGDQLAPATDVPHLHFVLVVPPFGCPTVDVYKNFAAEWHGGAPQATLDPLTVPQNWDAAVRMGFPNDLEAAACRVRPELATLRTAVAELGHPEVRMTGSGSTWFVACQDAAAAARCRVDLQPLERRGIRLLPVASFGPAAAPEEHPWPASGHG